MAAGAGLTALACGGGAAGSDAPAEPEVSPFPSITSLLPDTALAGASSATITVNGSGFTRSSAILVSAQPAATTYQSATQISATIGATQLATTGTLAVRVSNPAPGGGLSVTFSIAVRNPLPVIASLSPSSIEAGGAALAVQIAGTGFVDRSVVQVGGVSRPTTFVSSTRLTVALAGDDVKQAGAAEIRVQNPTPGGGASAPMQLAVTLGQPVITRLPSAAATAGRPGFALAVDGQRFTPSSVVTWNGSDRTTTFISGTRLTAAINAADVANAGVAQIAVRTPGAATSATAVLTVRSLASASVSDVITVPFPVQDAVYDARTDRIYATVSPSGAGNANSVIAVDPRSGQITGSVFVGTDPRRIVRSSDGQFLYVTLNGGADVRRVQVSPLAAMLQFGMGAGIQVGDLEVVPGNSRSLAIARVAGPYAQNVRVYDDDQPRPKSVTSFNTVDVIAFGPDASVLYGFNNESTGADFYTMTVDASGLSVQKTTGAGVLGTFDTYFLYAAGRIYSTSGAVADPERHARVGKFSADGNGPVCVAPDLGRAYFIKGGTVAAFDLNTYLQLGSVTVVPTEQRIASVPSRPIRWGDDGLAFTDGSALYIFRTSLASK